MLWALGVENISWLDGCDEVVLYRPCLQRPDILLFAGAVMSRYVAQNNIRLLFGCGSFAGLDTGRYLDAFALLKAHYSAPARQRPRVSAHAKRPQMCFVLLHGSAAVRI